MQSDAASVPYTILRIKRKRNEEPLDALVVESRVRRKKSRGGVDVFQFAQTVEDDDWNDEKRKKDLEAQISRLAREASSNKEETKPAVDQQLAKPVSPVSKQQREDVKRRYTILDGGAGSRAKKPPTVISAKEAAQINFKVYDAIPSLDKPRPIEPSSEIEKFIPLLNEYLSLNEIVSPSAQPIKKREEMKSSEGTSRTSGVAADDYVWDVFYRRPATVAEWDGNGNVATLTGLPSADELYDSSSDSEPEDEADEDSNAEEYYKNDYPDEEEDDEDDYSNSASDGSNEDSDFQDLLRAEDDGDEWSLRL